MKIVAPDLVIYMAVCLNGYGRSVLLIELHSLRQIFLSPFAFISFCQAQKHYMAFYSSSGREGKLDQENQ